MFKNCTYVIVRLQISTHDVHEFLHVMNITLQTCIAICVLTILDVHLYNQAPAEFLAIALSNSMPALAPFIMRTASAL